MSRIIRALIEYMLDTSRHSLHSIAVFISECDCIFIFFTWRFLRRLCFGLSVNLNLNVLVGFRAVYGLSSALGVCPELRNFKDIGMLEARGAE